MNPAGTLCGVVIMFSGGCLLRFQGKGFASKVNDSQQQGVGKSCGHGYGDWLVYVCKTFGERPAPINSLRGQREFFVKKFKLFCRLL